MQPVKVRSQGTISEFDSGGCQSLSLNALAGAHPGLGANYPFIDQANLCFQNRKSCPNPFQQTQPEFDKCIGLLCG